MGVAETERALTRVAEERQRQRDDNATVGDHALLWAGAFSLFVGHAVGAAFDRDADELRECLTQIAALAVALLEMSDGELGVYALPDDVASGA